ncbi:MAG: hypothetical protein ACI8X5_000459 [Planctomycetota bacterium]|jgi:hypothetical protein
MQLDDLKEAWAAHGTMLERSIAIDERLLREMMLRKVRFALAPYVVCRALEVALGIAMIFAAVSVLVVHLTEPRYLLVAGALAVFSVGITAQWAYLLVNVLRLDQGGPVTKIQQDVERIQLVEYLCFKWALLGGIVFWLPALLVPFEAVTGVDALARADLAWLIANIVLGLLLLGIGHLLSRRYVESSDLEPRARRFVEALSGRGLRSASAYLEELASFERDEPPAQ